MIKAQPPLFSLSPVSHSMIKVQGSSLSSPARLRKLECLALISSELINQSFRRCSTKLSHLCFANMNFAKSLGTQKRNAFYFVSKGNWVQRTGAESLRKAV